MKATILSMDYFGRGIASLDKKTFVRDALPGEEVEINVTRTHKTFDEAEITKIYEESPYRIKPECPYYPKCGACSLRSLSYSCSLEYKYENIKKILNKFIDENIEVNLVLNKEKTRNKVVFKVVNKEFGFYEVRSNNVCKIDKCLNVKECINNIIPNLKSLNIINGEIMVRANFEDKILISINSKDKVNIDSLLDCKNVVGIIYNDKNLFGDDYFYEQINDYKFKVSYKSFFQVSNYINSQIFSILGEEINKDCSVLDLCCGVGSLSIAASHSKKVLGIEVNQSSIKDANYNAKINNVKNVEFIKADAFARLKDFKASYDTLIVDPPRSGIKKIGIVDILNAKFKKIIYISCNTITLKRDLSLLNEVYKLRKIYILDMFPFTYHSETITVLEKK